MAQSHINSLPYNIANIQDRKVPEITNTVEREEYINCISPSDLEQFQTQEGIDFTKLMLGSNKSTEELEWM